MLGKQPIFTIHAELETITSLGRTPYGERRVIGILGGKRERTEAKRPHPSGRRRLADYPQRWRSRYKGALYH